MNCKQCKLTMSGAATDVLSVPARMEFDAHVRGCARCREEYARVRGLLEAIDRGVLAQAGAEPSSDFLARVRRRIATETIPSKTIWAWLVPATAAAAAILAIALWQFWPRNAGPRIVQIPVVDGNSVVASNHAIPSSVRAPVKVVTSKKVRPIATIREVAIHKPLRIDKEPEVLVPPGQGETVLKFAAALQSGKIDGAKLMADIKSADQPIEIKPLVIAPLESSAEEGDKSSGPGGNGAPKDFVSGEPVRSLMP